ncbi:Hint domain-containing protein [uncultured Roseovarius sp.]|uniref:Hint domain-containing protein n=1 Tax=uncultured Roseovarius sp. TaxID=293344 RepID=UPI002620C6FD|nr:Hint domain-containing protein [uncultured Roseovarius sp.]
MVLRNFFAIDSANLVVDSSPNSGIVGDPVINNSSTPNGTIFTYSGGGGATVTLDDTGGRRNTFEDDDENNHIIANGGGLLPNGTAVEAESLILMRALDGSGNPTGPTITITVFSQGGVTGDVWGFATDTELQDGVSYIKTGGSNIGDSRYRNFITCFGPRTRIQTPDGQKRVETIKPGQLVWTRDNGNLPVKWVGSTTVPGKGAFAPVVFAPNSIGNVEELVVSPEHRIFVTSAMAEVLFGQPEVLIAAKHLCGLPGVSIREQDEIRYTHLMFDTHQIILSNGSLTESFFLSKNALAGVSSDQRQELLALFPSLDEGLDQFGDSAALTLKKSDATLMRAYLT